MASAFSKQLRTIAAKSSNELDLRAQRDAHAESIIFEHDVAVKQGWDSLYEICAEGFQELCLLDERLLEFDRSLFSVHSKDQDRGQLNKVQNEHLDEVLEKCLSVISSRILLKPGIQTLEWLVRRFKVHIHNTEALLLGLLPYHEHSIFQTILSVIPAKSLTQKWKFLGQYCEDPTVKIPRRAIVYSLTNNDGLFATFNNYTVKTCQDETSYASQVRFWGGVIVESVAERLKQSKSGRKEIQRQRTEDILLKLLPLLNDGFELRDCPEMHMVCLSISVILASTAELGDRVLDSLMDAVATTMSYETMDLKSSLTTIALLISHKEESILPRRVFKSLVRLPNLVALVREIRNQIPLIHFSTAFVRTSLRRLTQKNYSNILKVLHDFMLAMPLIIDSVTIAYILRDMFSQIKQLDNSQEDSNAIRNQIVNVLRSLSLEHSFSSSFSVLTQNQDQDEINIEIILETAIADNDNSRLPTKETPEVENVDSEEALSEALRSIPETSKETSFLSGQTSSLFRDLTTAFIFAQSRSDLLDTFKSLHLWRSKASSTPYISFLLRMALGNFQDQHRSLAIKLLGDFVKERSDIDSQVLILYLSIFLADNTMSVRIAAAKLALAMEKSAPKNLVEGEDCERLGADDIYNSDAMSKILWCTSSHLIKLIQQVYLPILEECVLDPSQIGKGIRIALNGKASLMPSESKVVNIEIKKNLKHGLFTVLTSHAVATSSLKVKVGTINLLDDVSKVGSSTKIKFLSPLLNGWLQTSSEEATQQTELEGLRMDLTDDTMAELISPLDNESINRVFHVLAEKGTETRTEFLEAIFKRITFIWDSMKDEVKTTVSTQLYDLSFNDITSLAGGARAVLQNVNLPSETLALLLEHACTASQNIPTEGPPRKLRRMSRGREVSVPGTVLDLQALTSRISLALELIHDSKPEKRPELMGSLFDLLPILRRLKDQERLESPYLFNLCLNSILAIIDHARTLQKSSLEITRIRADLVADCVRSIENPQVQNTALLLSASLAAFAPQKVLHNIMPIFTIMGTTMLSKEDEHSVHVVNQAIDQIIPPMLSNIRRQNPNNILLSTSDLVSSFVAAFDHVPQHRRIKFFRRLIARLGPEDFAFVVIAMLLSRKQEEHSVKAFCINLLAELPPLVQIVTYSKLTGLIHNIYSEDFHLVEPLLNISEKTPESEKKDIVLVLFVMAEEILKSRNLMAAVRELNKLESFTFESLRQNLKLCFRQILEIIKMVKQNNKALLTSAKKCLSSLLQLPPLVEMFHILPEFFTEMENSGDDDLRTYALEVFASHLRLNHPKDIETQNAAIKFLSELSRLLNESQAPNVKQAVIACIDQVTENYGRRHVETAIDIAMLISGECGIGSSDRRVSIASMLCLASIMEVLGEAAVPVASTALSRAFTLLEKELGLENPDIALHDAVYSLISSFITHVPFILSEDTICSIVNLSAESASLYVPKSSAESRQDTLKLLANKIEFSTLLDGLKKTWLVAVENDVNAVLEHLEILEVSVENRPKSEVIRLADQISGFILQALDLRRIQFTQRDEDSYAENDVVQIETKINSITVKFIYKLNDTVFRPLFETWIDWAVQCNDLSSSSDKAKTLRQTSLFAFLTHFFETLKSIVTSYSGYVIEPANAILRNLPDILKQSASHNNRTTDQEDQLNLYSSLFSSLKASFTHDADGFYNAPSHFSPLCENLISHLELAGLDTKKQQPLNPRIGNEVIPTIVSFATATLDTPSHHHRINHNLYNLRHHESAAVRMATIKTHLALTESEEVGDEWINHVVLGTTGEAGGGGSSDTMIYVNEMLEDDDEDVEAEVRRWVRIVRDRVGENVFED